MDDEYKNNNDEINYAFPLDEVNSDNSSALQDNEFNQERGDHSAALEKIIDGKAHAHKREAVLKSKLLRLDNTISVVSILIGNDPPSVLYTNLKKKKAIDVGIDFKAIHLAESILFEDVVTMIKRFNDDSQIDGIMIQLPLPKAFLQSRPVSEITELIDPKKDIDGLTTSRLVPPAAVKATMCLIEEEQIELEGMRVVVMGASDLVGKPMASELEKAGAHVSVIDSKTENPEEITRNAQLIVTAVGKPGILTGDMVSEGVIILDIGTLVIEDELSVGEAQKKVVGDVDFESVFPKASKITPVPGGVGPMTIIALLENCLYLKDLALVE
jgi:methylenetetrahydrofolate dehydrogenase (NADP+)/methenyltetrahydrofolate cyclohydrolase